MTTGYEEARETRGRMRSSPHEAGLARSVAKAEGEISECGRDAPCLFRPPSSCVFQRQLVDDELSHETEDEECVRHEIALEKPARFGAQPVQPFEPVPLPPDGRALDDT